MDVTEQLHQLEETVKDLSQQLEVHQKKIVLLEKEVQDMKAANSITIPAAKPGKVKTALSEKQGLENFIGLRLIHLIGIVVLVIGLSIGVKYAIDRNLISEMARIILVYAAGAILFLLSWRLKKSYASFSAILFSGSMASLYFTTYAAFVYYNLFSTVLAFALMIVFTFFAVYQALQYDKKEIAVLGLTGAYAIPFLISKNSGRADLFFGYILLINLGVVFLSFKKHWQVVGRLAQLLTILLFLGWVEQRYTAAQKGTAILYLTLFFLLFEANALGNRLLRSVSINKKEVQQLIVNNAVAYIAALSVFATAYSRTEVAAVSGVFALFLALQAVAFHQLMPQEKYTIRMHAAFAFILLVIFIGFEWQGILVTLLWLATAVLLFGWGLYVKSNSFRMASIVLMGTTLLKLLIFDSLKFTTIQKVIAYITLGILLLIVSFLYQKFRQQLFQDEEE